MRNLAVLEIQDLSLRFMSKPLFIDLSFSLQKGEKVTISGKSGSGKTTLLRCILGFFIPDTGSITIAGERLTEISVWKVRQKIGFVPQEPDLGDTTTLEFLQFPFSFKANRSLQWDKKLLQELMEILHLDEELLQKRTTLLSGGEKQRVALLSSLLLKRDFYLLDEVTSALDDETRRAVIEYLNQKKDTTILFASHDKAIKAISHQTITLKGKSNHERIK